jgi:hypothetical protein
VLGFACARRSPPNTRSARVGETTNATVLSSLRGRTVHEQSHGIPNGYGPSYPQFRARPAEIKRSVKISLPSPGERSKYRPPTAARRNDSPRPTRWGRSPDRQPDDSALNGRTDGTAGVRPFQPATSQPGRSNGPPQTGGPRPRPKLSGQSPLTDEETGTRFRGPLGRQALPSVLEN